MPTVQQADTPPSGMAPGVYAAEGDSWVYVVEQDGSITVKPAEQDQFRKVGPGSPAFAAIQEQISSGQLTRMSRQPSQAIANTLSEGRKAPEEARSKESPNLGESLSDEAVAEHETESMPGPDTRESQQVDTTESLPDEPDTRTSEQPQSYASRRDASVDKALGRGAVNPGLPGMLSGVKNLRADVKAEIAKGAGDRSVNPGLPGFVKGLTTVLKSNRGADTAARLRDKYSTSGPVTGKE